MYKNIKTLIDLKNCEPDYGMALMEVLNIFSGKWKMIIICAIFQEDLRFTEIRKLIPAITPRMLSKELKDLEMSGIVKRTVIDSTPVRINYGLTASAMDLSTVISDLLEWGIKHRQVSTDRPTLEPIKASV
jgi:DNA-binding HxlR family transcriptional regulator